MGEGKKAESAISEGNKAGSHSNTKQLSPWLEHSEWGGEWSMVGKMKASR